MLYLFNSIKYGCVYYIFILAIGFYAHTLFHSLLYIVPFATFYWTNKHVSALVPPDRVLSFFYDNLRNFQFVYSKIIQSMDIRCSSLYLFLELFPGGDD